MSKLRADITYSHRLKSNDTSEFTMSDIDINELFINQNRENNNTTDDVNTSTRKNNEIDEESDDEIDQTDTENEFNNYLQGWEDMLKEEELADYEEDDIDSNDSDNSNNLGRNSNIVDNIIHPAIDTNAKWILTTLFKNNLKLPF
jgi:hypothetical protein